MENASKALLMAAGVLMGVLILTLAVILFSTFRASADESYQQMREEQDALFNSFYISYEGNTKLTYYDIWNVIKKAKEDMKTYDGHIIKVFYNNTDLQIQTTKDYSIKDIQVVLGLDSGGVGTPIGTIAEEKTDTSNPGKTVYSLVEFTCTEVKLDESGRVNEIRFTRT